MRFVVDLPYTHTWKINSVDVVLEEEGPSGSHSLTNCGAEVNSSLTSRIAVGSDLGSGNEPLVGSGADDGSIPIRSCEM